MSAPPGVDDVLALSPLQLGLYSLAGLTEDDGGPDPYLIAMAADIEGSFDVGLLRSCAETMLQRHPNLRASYFQGNLSRPVAIVPTNVDLPWRHVKATAAEARDVEAEERARRFDLAKGPLLRFLLIEQPDARWRLVVTAHHIAIDGWSLPVFVGELLALYRFGGDASALPAEPRPYRDYIGWLAGRDTEASRTRWRTHLAGLTGPTMLSPVLSGLQARPGLPARTEVTLDPQATAELLDAARVRGVTVNTLFQMAWAAVLSAIVDRSDVVFGVTVSGRPDELSGVETMVGLFINTVPLRVVLDPTERVGRQCLALQREAAELRDHSHLSHTELRAAGGIGELYDTLLVYENFPPGSLVGSEEFALADAVLKPAALESLSHFPVTIAAHPSDGRLTVLVEILDGALGLLDPAQLGKRLLTVVQRLVASWDRPLREVAITLDGEAPAAGRLNVDAPVGGFHTAVTEVAAECPDAVALSWDSGELTYAELDGAADRLAAVLVSRGVGAETPVPIRLSRGPDYIVAMLAVLKAGGLIVPLDPAMPQDRVDDILGQTGAAMVIDDGFVASGAAQSSPDFRPAVVRPGQGAYVVFTSGTTGKPKGVIGTHSAVLSYGADHVRNVLRPAAERLGRPLRIAHAWSFTFDAAWQPLVALLDGHAVHIVGDDVQRDAEALVATIGRFGIDLIDTTPSMFTQLLSAGLLSEVPLAVLALGGEAIDPAAWDVIRAHCARLGMTAHNCYGPTETTVEAVVAAIADYDRPGIGVPTESMAAYVLDAWLRPVPDGVPGELFLSGGQLTRGYLGRAGETSARFVADPIRPGARMYRTGDVVRRNPESNALEFLGRSDDQVKIRGFRVEPGDVAAALHAHRSVRGAHVAVRRHRSGPRLTAYVVTDAPVADLRRMLISKLPGYLVPHHIIAVDEIPLNTNGKVDDAALKLLDAERRTDVEQAPATATEAVLAEVLADVLGGGAAGTVDVTADFLDLGLDSIVALSVVQAVRRRGLPLRARLMLECATIRELAAAIDNDGEVDPDGDGVDSATPIPALASAHWLYEYGDPRRLSQTEAVRLPAGVTRHQLEMLLRNIIDGHQVLRSRLDRTTMSFVATDGDVVVDVLSEVEVVGSWTAAVAEQTSRSVERLDPERGVMLDVVWLRDVDGGPGVLLLSPHVLAMDPASWRIVLGELEAGWHALAEGRDPAPAREHTSLRRWSHMLSDRALKLETCDFWLDQLSGDDPEIGSRAVDPDTDRVGDVVVDTAFVDSYLTARLLAGAAGVTATLAAATARALTVWRRSRGQSTPPPLLAVETHGRADSVVSAGLGDEARLVDTGDTVGLLSAIYPIRVTPDDAAATAELFAAIPGDGIDYALLRYLRADTAERLGAHRDPQVLLNYLGRFHRSGDADALQLDRALLVEASKLPEPNLAVRYELTLAAAVVDQGGAPMLGVQWRALPDILSATDIAALQSIWLDALREVIE